MTDAMKTTAKHLRELADRIEADEFEAVKFRAKAGIRDITKPEDKWRNYEATGKVVYTLSTVRARVNDG